MNYRTLISLTIIICISHSSFGSSYSTLKGTLKDECGQNIDNVRVDIVSQTGFIKQLYTDADGKFKVDSLVSNVEYSLRFVKTKFFGNTADIMLNKDTLINIELQHIPYSITPFPIITFEYEEFEVTPNYRDSLVGFITVMKQNPTLVIGLVVYRDSSEIVDLSKKRGCSVMSLIISLGIDSNRLVIEKSNVPNKLKTGDLIYDCYSKQYIVEGKVLTEKYLLSVPNKEQEELRRLNRSICFRIVSD